MNSTRLFWRIFGLLVISYILLAIGLVAYVVTQQRNMFKQTMAVRLEKVAILVGEQISNDPSLSQAEVQQRISELAQVVDARLTVMLDDGTVLADSSRSPKDLPNHTDRPEVVLARKEGKGESERFSETLQIRMLYVCIARELEPLEENDDDPERGERGLSQSPSDSAPVASLSQRDLESSPIIFVRAAHSMKRIDRQIGIINRSLLVFALTLAVIAVLATWLVSRRVISPLSKITDAANAIARGDYETSVGVSRHVSDWGMFASAFSRMQSELQFREEELRANSKRLETVLASMSEGVIAVSGSGEIRFSNQAALRLLGLGQASEIDGRSIFEILRVPVVKQTLDEVWSTGGSQRCEFETRGTPRRILLMRTSRLPDEETQGLVCVLHDMTEIRQLETMRRDFVANVSHELKTPLASIKAYAETLRLGAINDQVRNVEFVERIEFQADRLHQLILDLLHLARVESGQTLYEVTSINVAQVVDSSFESFNRLAISRDVELDRQIDEHLRVTADAEGLRAVVDNLISNAIRYTLEGGKVSVRCFADGDCGVIEVADSGIGIAPEHQQRVFERFYRVDKARSSDLGGTGLGLAIVKHLCHSFGGTVSLESKVGRGSTFSIRLPREA